MFTFTNKRMVLSSEGKIKMMRQIDNGKKRADLYGNLVSLILQSKWSGKQNKNYWCVWTERIENKAISKTWAKWRRWGAA